MPPIRPVELVVTVVDTVRLTSTMDTARPGEMSRWAS